jgi:hypothetical protein
LSSWERPHDEVKERKKSLALYLCISQSSPEKCEYIGEYLLRNVSGVIRSDGRTTGEQWEDGECKSQSLKAQEPAAPISKGRRRPVSQLKRREIDRETETKNLLLLCLLFCLGPDKDGQCSPTLVRVDSFLTQSTDSSANLFQKNSHRQTQK